MMDNLTSEETTFRKGSISLRHNDISRILVISIREVFNKVFFLFLESTTEPPVSVELPYEANISFSSDTVQGHITLQCNHKLVEEMVENSLNIERQEITETIIEDCLKEALNMVCGRFLKGLSPHSKVCFSIPEVRKTNKKEKNGNFILFFIGNRGAYLKAILKIKGGPHNGQEH